MNPSGGFQLRMRTDPRVWTKRTQRVVLPPVGFHTVPVK